MVIRFAQVDQRAAAPVGVWLARGYSFLDLLVCKQNAQLRVNRDHLSRAQPSLLNNLQRIKLDHSRFRGDDYKSVASNGKPGGSQPVPIKRRADHSTVGKGHGRGTVPGFRQTRRVFIEASQI